MFGMSADCRRHEQPGSQAMHIPSRRNAAALILTTLVLVVGLAPAISAPAAASRLHTVWATERAVARAKVTQRVTASAVASATVPVAGSSPVTVSVRATAIAQATRTAERSVTARSAGVATSRAKARIKAIGRARRAARSRSAAIARSLATRRAHASAYAAAKARATAKARSQALAKANALAATKKPTPTPTAPCGDATIAKSTGGTWQCSFDDEFAGTTLDASKWTVQTTAASGFTAGPTCFVDDTDNISVASGTLNLTVRKEAAPFTCKSSLKNFTTQYTSGSVNGFGKFSQTYGRFEVRAKLPAATVKGLQETLWLWPVNPLKYGRWPGSGEIDFGEFYSSAAGWNIPYIHYNSTTAKGDWNTNSNVFTALPAPYAQPGMNCRIDQSAFNTYTVIWQPGQITLQVNGNNCIVNNYTASGLTGGAPFDQPFFMALTQGLGIGTNAFDSATPLPATTQVDYVRMWS
jgi:beta-glucanase (GH16 family)